MDVLREREVKDSLERQLQDEQKVRGEYKSARFYLIERSREARCSAKRRIEMVDLLRFTSGTQSAYRVPRTCSFEKIDLAGKRHIDRGPRERETDSARGPRHTR